MSRELKQFSILIIEDEDNILNKLVKYLSNRYQKVYGVLNAEDALKVYVDKKPDIIIVDIHLPKMNGLEFIRLIRKEDISTKIIILTAYNEVDYLMKASSLKLTDYLVKPITRQALHQTLCKATDEIQKFCITSNHKLQLRENYSWIYKKNELYCDDILVDLRKQEQKVLELMFNNINYTFSYDEIANKIWGIDYEDKTNSIKLIIKTLRKKLPKEMIINIYGLGYKLSI